MKKHRGIINTYYHFVIEQKLEPKLSNIQEKKGNNNTEKTPTKQNRKKWEKLRNNYAY